MNSQAMEGWNGDASEVVELYDATTILGCPFKVILKDSVSLVKSGDGVVRETIIPDPDGLVKAVAQYRVMNPIKLGPADLKFIRSAMRMKSKDFAQLIKVTPEHLSRLESGQKPLTLQSDMFVRMVTFVITVGATMRKDVKATELIEIAMSQFVNLDIKTVRPADEEIVLHLVRIADEEQADVCDNGLWNKEELVAA